MILKPITTLVARVAHAHDPDTDGHAQRLVQISEILAESIGLDHEAIQEVGISALLHDIGKNAVPDAILFKRGRLDEHERKIVSKHTVEGYELLKSVRHPAFDLAADVALSHHETFNGGGYPFGRSGNDISLAARIVAVADVYDALRSARPYKAGMTHQEAYNIITKGDGRTSPENFDPRVLEAFDRRLGDVGALYF
ncbi:MAG: HD-GYP domain-containing protein [Ferrovibrio sp.]|uniref:HD-GYP domain-containing protein n=1 Tax=Ferrovibrio sp. TaxID=1917215 RepID=UPI00391CEF08